LCPVHLRCTYPSANLGGESEKRPRQVVFQNPPKEGVRAFGKVAELHPLLCFFIIPFFLEKIKWDQTPFRIQTFQGYQ
jgi:hypothetical protein